MTPPAATPGFFNAELIANPYPIYRYLHSTDPVHWAEGIQVWIVTRYDDVAAGLRNPRLSSARVGVLEAGSHLPSSKNISRA